MFGLRHLDFGHIIPQKVNPVKLYCSVKIFLTASFTIVWPPTKSTCRNMSNTLQTDLPKIFLRHEYLKQRRLLDCPEGSKCRTHSSLRARAFLPTSTTTRCKIFRNWRRILCEGKMRCMKETVWIPGARCNRKVPNYGWIQNRHSYCRTQDDKDWHMNVGGISFTE